MRSFFLSFLARFYYICQAGLGTSLRSQLPEYWDYRCVPPPPTHTPKDLFALTSRPKTMTKNLFVWELTVFQLWEIIWNRKLGIVLLFCFVFFSPCLVSWSLRSDGQTVYEHLQLFPFPFFSHICLHSAHGEHIGLGLRTLSSIWDLASTEREVEYKDPWCSGCLRAESWASDVSTVCSHWELGAESLMSPLCDLRCAPFISLGLCLQSGRTGPQ